MFASGNDQGTLIGQFLGPQILGKRRFLGMMTKQFAGFGLTPPFGIHKNTVVF